MGLVVGGGGRSENSEDVEEEGKMGDVAVVGFCVNTTLIM